MLSQRFAHATLWNNTAERFHHLLRNSRLEVTRLHMLRHYICDPLLLRGERRHRQREALGCSVFLQEDA